MQFPDKNIDMYVLVYAKQFTHQYYSIGPKLYPTYGSVKTGTVLTSCGDNVMCISGHLSPGLRGRIVVYHESGYDIVYECFGKKTLKLTPSPHGIEGQIQLKGDGVFHDIGMTKKEHVTLSQMTTGIRQHF